MDPTPSAEAGALLELARSAVAHAVREGRALEVDLEGCPPALRQPRAVFLTLRSAGELRGCTGSLEATCPLAQAVTRAAFRTALHDPRFPAVQVQELGGLEIQLSVLGPLEPLPAASQEELLAALRPGLDGLVLRDGASSGTFLPGVWKTLPAPADFVAELKRKAGLPRDHWSPTLRFQRYRVEELP